jgi:hypothetical protein
MEEHGMKLRTKFLTVLVLAAMTSVTYAQSPELSGKWVFNPAKSQEKGQTAFEIMTVELNNGTQTDKVHSAQKGQAGDSNSERSAKVDGSESAVKNPRTGNLSYLSYRQMFPRVEEVNQIRHVKGPDGTEVSEVTGHIIRILSADGKELTSVVTDAKGDVTGVRVFDKQSGAESPN